LPGWRCCGSENWPNQSSRTGFLPTRPRMRHPCRHLSHVAAKPAQSRKWQPQCEQTRLMFPYFYSYLAAARQIATNSSATREEPPIRPPSISG